MEIQENIQLAPFTSFKIGGPAKYFVEVSAEEALLEALRFAKKNNLKIFLLGGGSNILVGDEGFDGLVIKMKNTESNVSEDKIECGVGINLAEVVGLSVENSLTGLEWAVGIPGTLGGAICGNAGAYGSSIADSLENVKIIKLDNLEFEIMSKDECKFAYRESVFKENKNLIIVSAVLKLQKGNQEEIKNKIEEIIRQRGGKIPPERSSGSFFKNPKVDNQQIIAKFEKETGNKVQDGTIPAAYLIDKVGLKGKKIGEAQVSEKHGNFVVNLGHARAEDIVMLTSFVKMKVRDELGIELKEEVQYIGF